jgi:uncharacterized protein YkwD
MRATRVAPVLVLAAVQLIAAPGALAQAVPDPNSVLGAALPAAPKSCASASAAPNTVSPAALRAAMLCAINVERARHGLPALPADARVQKAATGHARDMVRRHYFAHKRANGPSLGGRLKRAGWRGRAAGEAIAYGCAGRGTPLATLRMWLNSPPHRAILLDRSWRNAGVGVRRGAPVRGCTAGATWVLDATR